MLQADWTAAVTHLQQGVCQSTAGVNSTVLPCTHGSGCWWWFTTVGSLVPTEQTLNVTACLDVVADHFMSHHVQRMLDHLKLLSLRCSNSLLNPHSELAALRRPLTQPLLTHSVPCQNIAYLS